MVNLSNLACARGQTIIYGVKRGKVPTELRSRMLPQRREQGHTSCIEEISRMMECLKKNKYDEKECSAEISFYFACAEKAIERRESGHARPTRTTEEINTVLRKYSVEKKKINKI